ncbi:18035_t:CDS:1, partial [Racocetra persica]
QLRKVKQTKFSVEEVEANADVDIVESNANIAKADIDLVKANIVEEIEDIIEDLVKDNNK